MSSKSEKAPVKNSKRSVADEVAEVKMDSSESQEEISNGEISDNSSAYVTAEQSSKPKNASAYTTGQKARLYGMDEVLGKQLAASLGSAELTGNNLANVLRNAGLGLSALEVIKGIMMGTPRLRTSSEELKLENSNETEILNLREKTISLQRQLTKALKEIDASKQEEVDELMNTIREIKSKEGLNHILSRIREEAKQLLLSSEDFRNSFQNASNVKSVVMSIDIRRSTELMLKARTPQKYAQFMTALTGALSDVIIDNFGIFDKFTGDGILAFFPDFYSQDNAALFAVRAAKICHDVFDEFYNLYRSSFNVFIKDVGLGIGIDYGSVTLVNSGSELTLVGIPVVYACRMSSGPKGITLLNQPAMEHLSELCGKYVRFTETEINIKNEGYALAYTVEVEQSYIDDIANPSWLVANVDQGTPETP